jgi:hydrogenase maturation protease
VIEATEFSLSDGVAAAVPLMEKTLLDYLQTIGISGHKKAEVDIHAILPNSFKALNAYSV